MIRKGIRYLYKKAVSPLLQNAYQRYAKSDHSISFFDLELTVLSGVFHPGFFYSTKALIRHLSSLDIKKKSLLELGCGSGAISTWAASHGAVVTASDINPRALENVQLNASHNGVEVKAVQSDLFDALKDQRFDLVVINPPYYPKTAQNMEESAWFCGDDFQYFQKLFDQVVGRNDGLTLMILSEDCNIEHIKKLSEQFSLKLELIRTMNSMMEKNFIFKVQR